MILTIQDARGAQATVNNSIVVRSITGHWVDSDPRYQMDFVQTGSTFNGTVTASGFGRVSNIANGVVSNPRSVAFHRSTLSALFVDDDYVGTLDSSLDGMTLRAVNAQSTFNLRRQ